MDFVLEAPGGRLVGVEAKAGASVGPGDFKGLRLLADATRGRFVRDVVLYCGRQVVPFAADLHAVPVPALWDSCAD